MKVWDKHGNVIDGAPLSVFYDTGNHKLSDPLIRYDDESKRWFTAIMDTGERDASKCTPQCSILVAVSKTDDPTGTWHLIEFPFGNKFADYPSMDLTTNKFILSVNLFTLTEPRQGDAHVAVVDKNAMLQGSNITYNLIKLPNVLTAYTINTLKPSNCGYLTSTTDYPQTYQTGISNKLRLFTVCGDPLANNITSKTFSMIDAPFPQNGKQPPLGADRPVIDTGDIRVKSAVFDGERIWQSFNVSCQPSQSFSLQSCIRFQQIDPTASSGASLVIDKNIGISNNDIYYPTMTINNQGKMIFSSAYSGPTIHPSVVLGDQDTLTNQQLYLVKQGSATYQGDRFGDYCETAVDPIDRTLWASCEYMDRNNADLWSTYIFNIK